MNDQTVYPIDINLATEEDLVQVQGLGPVLAKRIIAARPFERVEDLTRVNGIGEAFLERLRPFVTVGTESVEPVETTGIDENSEDPQVFEAEIEVLTPEEIKSKPIPTGIADQPAPPLEPTSAYSEAAYPDQPGAESAKTAKAQPAEKTVTVSRTDLIWASVATGVITLILAVLFSLGFLSLRNGSLTYATSSQASQISSRVDALDNQVMSLQDEVNSLRSRVDTLETISGRVTKLEDQTKTLQADLKTAQSGINALNQETAQIQDRLTVVEETAVRFQRFLDGLRELLAEPVPVEGGVK